MPHQVVSIVFLILIALTPWFVLITYYRRMPYNCVETTLHLIACFCTRILWRTQLDHRLEVGDRQGALIICNHRSSIDPFFIQTTLLRKSHWMVAKEYFSNPLFGWFLRTVEAIPVNRGGIDTASTKTAIRLAASGELVGVFPEGRLNVGQDFMLPCRAGAVLVALRAKVPIIPCYIDGAPFREPVWSPFFMTARVHVRFGKPIDVANLPTDDASNQVLGDLMLKCVREIAALAGRPDFEPKLAGRRWKTPD